MSNNFLSNLMKKRNIIFIIIILLLIVTLGVCGYLLYEKINEIKTVTTEKEVVIEEKETLQGEYDVLLHDFSDLEASNDLMADEIEEHKDKIKEFIAEIERNKNDKRVIAKLRKELGTMREIMKSFVRQIDSLNTLNVKLTKENDKITKENIEVKEAYSNELDKSERLSEKVAIASKLEAFNIKCLALKSKSGVEKVTTKGNKANKIKICYSIRKNEVTPKGTKEIYIRIAQPDGKILTDGMGDEFAFEMDGQLINFTTKERVDYKGKELNICSYYKVKEELQDGLYNVEIFFDEKEIGNSTFTLK